MDNNLVHIQEFRALKHRRRRLEVDVIFILGILLTMVAPTAIYVAFGGPVPFPVFLFTSLTGIICGLVYYSYYPYQVISCIDKNRTSRTTPTTGRSTPPPTVGTARKAA